MIKLYTLLVCCALTLGCNANIKATCVVDEGRYSLSTEIEYFEKCYQFGEGVFCNKIHTVWGIFQQADEAYYRQDFTNCKVTEGPYSNDYTPRRIGPDWTLQQYKREVEQYLDMVKKLGSIGD